MGSADLKATFGSKRHELNVSTYQVQHLDVKACKRSCLPEINLYFC